MRFPWANIALLVLIGAQVASGLGGLINGSEERGWILWIHGIGAYAVVLLIFWKGAIVLEALNRRRRANLARAAFLVLAVLLLASLASGLLWTFAGRRLFFDYSLITIHVILSVAVLALLVWHVLHMRFIFRVNSATDRRAFLRLGGLTLGGLALWQLSSRTLGALGLPGSQRRFTGSYEIGSFTGVFPTVSWLFDRPSPVNAADWRLVVDGEVERPMTLTYEVVRSMADDRLSATIDCTGGWYSAQEWQGVRVGRLMEMAGLRPTGLSVTFESVSGYGRRYPLEEASSCLLATMVAGKVLDHGHGFPARLVAPGHRGFDWVKWVTRIRVNDTSSLWQSPLPLQ